jgi:hypothetical protein
LHHPGSLRWSRGSDYSSRSSPLFDWVRMIGRFARHVKASACGALKLTLMSGRCVASCCTSARAHERRRPPAIAHSQQPELRMADDQRAGHGIGQPNEGTRRTAT